MLGSTTVLYLEYQNRKLSDVRGAGSYAPHLQHRTFGVSTPSRITITADHSEEDLRVHTKNCNFPYFYYYGGP